MSVPLSRYYQVSCMALTDGGHATNVSLSGHSWTTPAPAPLVEWVASDQYNSILGPGPALPSVQWLLSLTMYPVSSYIGTKHFLTIHSSTNNSFICFLWQTYHYQVLIKDKIQPLILVITHCWWLVADGGLFRWTLAPGVLWLLCFTCCLVMVIIFSRSIFISCFSNHQIIFFVGHSNLC